MLSAAPNLSRNILWKVRVFWGKGVPGQDISSRIVGTGKLDVSGRFA